MEKTVVIGDIHGDYERMRELVDPIPEDTRVIFIGDFFDRWNRSVDVARFVMNRPNTLALLGNHEALILGAKAERKQLRFGMLYQCWLDNRGQPADLEELDKEPELVDWLMHLPAMIKLEDDTLLQHSDNMHYLLHGDTLEKINNSFMEHLTSGDLNLLRKAFEHLCERFGFNQPYKTENYLERFNARGVIHGHTPHGKSQAQVSFSGRIVNVDGALSRGFDRFYGEEKRGFVYELKEKTLDDPWVTV